MESFAHLVCQIDDRAISFFGVDHTFYWWMKGIVACGITAGFLAVWIGAFPRLRVHGFGKLQWNMVGWFIVTMGIFQSLDAFGHAFRLFEIPCWASLLLPPLITVAFCVLAYCVHLYKGHKGTFSGFLFYVAWPAIGETIAGSKWIGFGIVRAIEVLIIR